MGYGHGAIMAVPAHDERDHEFAQAFGLPIVQVVEPRDGAQAPRAASASTARNVNSKNAERVARRLAHRAKPSAHHRVARAARHRQAASVNYKLRDWLFSRQRYWGEPFPIVFDAQGNHHAVARRRAAASSCPSSRDFKPEESDDPQAAAGQGRALGARPPPARPASRDLPPDAPGHARDQHDAELGGLVLVLPALLRSQERRSASIGEDAERYWLGENGVDLYIGGAEHAVLHLLYARFWHQVLHDLGHVQLARAVPQAVPPGPDHQLRVSARGQDAWCRSTRSRRSARTSSSRSRRGEPRRRRSSAKMSKSLKNVVNPDDVIAEYGADTFRLYEMYMGPLEASKPWNTRDISGLLPLPAARVAPARSTRARGELQLRAASRRRGREAAAPHHRQGRRTTSSASRSTPRSPR